MVNKINTAIGEERIAKLLAAKKVLCPQCRDHVFIPCIGNDGKDNLVEMDVWCVDSAHWVGRIEECFVSVKDVLKI